MTNQKDLDNHANQLNPNHEEYKGHEKGKTVYKDVDQDDLDNHANQLNPNSEEYEKSRK